MVRVHVQRALAGIHAARGLTRAGSERGIQ
jgi:hypothetical protein